MQRKFILISGKAESGKDTSASAMSDYLATIGKSFTIVRFGDMLKSILKTFSGWNGEKDIAGRQLLQDTSNSYRKNVSDTYFPEMLSGVIKAIYPDVEYILIPDTRYPQEIETIMSNFANDDVFCVRIERMNHENRLTNEQRLHDSEVSLDAYEYFDYVLQASTIEENYSKSIKILEEILNG